MDKHIRKIFSVFVLGMIVLFVLRLRADAWEPVHWMLLGTGALCCLLVFRVFVYIFNFSYALVCLLNGLLLCVLYPNLAAILPGAAIAIYGLRLLLFTWFRVHSDSYQQRVDMIAKADESLPAPVRFALWVQCTFLYCFHLFAIYYAGAAGVLGPAVIAGTVIILLGTLIEGLADAQKQKAKAVHPAESAPG